MYTVATNLCFCVIRFTAKEIFDLDLGLMALFDYVCFLTTNLHANNIVTYSGSSIHDGSLLHSKIQYTTLDYSSRLL
jgi:hypothetical protein